MRGGRREKREVIELDGSHQILAYQSFWCIFEYYYFETEMRTFRFTSHSPVLPRFPHSIHFQFETNFVENVSRRRVVVEHTHIDSGCCSGDDVGRRWASTIDRKHANSRINWPAFIRSFLHHRPRISNENCRIAVLSDTKHTPHTLTRTHNVDLIVTFWFVYFHPSPPTSRNQA